MKSSSTDVLWLCFLILTGVLVGVVLDPPASSSFTKKDLVLGLRTRATLHNNKPKRVLLGLNTNLDAIVNDGTAFLKLIAGVDETEKPKDLAVVTSPQELAAVFAHHFASSSAGERSIVNETLWREIEMVLDQDAYCQFSLGGNAALMAEAFAKNANAKALEIHLVGMTGPKIVGRLASKIHTDISGKKAAVVFGGETFQVDVDQVHLILEYSPSTIGSGSKWGGKKPDRANRFIVSSDASNGVLAALDMMKSSTYSHAPFDLIVLAGVHMMDGVSRAVQTDRLAAVVQYVASVPSSTRVHFELGSVGNKVFSRSMVEKMLLDGCADSVGFNEQEFVSVLDAIDAFDSKDTTRQALLGSIPPVIKVQAGIRRLFHKVDETKTSQCQHPLSRVHFHSFGYHLIVQRTSASALLWPNPDKAVAAGSVISTERACGRKIDVLHGSEINLNVNAIKYAVSGSDKTAQVTLDTPVIEWTDGQLAFFLAPVLACVTPKQTVGLGDYISATALQAQI